MNRACFTNATKRKRSHERSELNLHEKKHMRAASDHFKTNYPPVVGQVFRMKKKLLSWIFILVSFSLFAQKTVYIPKQFSTSPWNEWSPNYKYESANFVVFWGAKVGANPTTYSDANLRFDPAAICNYLEASFTKYVTELGFVTNTGNLAKYKIIVVMNETYAGAGGPTGWAFGGAYDEVIGALWIHPGATRDAYVIAHEFAHSLQNQNRIQQNATGGFSNYEPAGWFWESDANYMRCLQYPQFASDDMPRWIATRSYHLSSTRHHYDAFRWLMNIQQNFGGINTVTRLWKESVARETPIETWRRISGWNQTQLNDNMYDYAKREANFDYPAQGFGGYMRTLINGYKTSTVNNHYLWRYSTLLTQISATTSRYIVPDYAAPQDYGINVIPLYPTCASNQVHVKFKGHTEVNSYAGWRWGFVEVKSDGVTCAYSPMQSTSDGEATYTLTASNSKLYLIVMGAPTSKHDYVWEPGWPKIYRYPYELRIENAMPEGYQSNYRADVHTLYGGHAHSYGGGWVANSATVASTVYVGPKALVLGSSKLSGNVIVDGNARLENVTANTSVVFNGNVNVYGGSYSGTAQILDAAILNTCTVSGNNIIKGNLLAWNSTYAGNNLVIGGDAEAGSCSTAGVYLQFPHGNNGRADCDGKGVSDASNTDINNAYAQFTDAQMIWTAIGCGGNVDTQAPTVPTGLTSPGKTSNSVNLSWTASTDNVGVTGYQILVNGTANQTITGTAATITGLTANTAYSFTIKAFDNAGNYSAASSAISVTTLSSGGVDANIALIATASTSYVSSWETIKAVNDNSNPANSNDKTAGAYGNWNNPNTIEWVEYDWSSNYSISKTEVYWFDDAGGVLTPTSAYVEYWNGSAWINCGNVPLAKNAWNSLNISGVTTNKFRISMKNSTQSTGILEWRVWGQSTSGLAAKSAAMVADNNSAGEVVIYPNPAKSQFSVELNDFSSNENINLFIYDINGKQIVHREIQGSGKIDFDASTLELSGIYLIKVKSNTKVAIKKLVVEP